MQALTSDSDLSYDRHYGHITTEKGRPEILAFVRYPRRLHPPEVRIAVVVDNFSPHTSTKNDPRFSRWTEANNIVFTDTSTYSSWHNRIEASSRSSVDSRSTALTSPAKRSRPP